ncbi:hypothetical protein SLEP1_g7526 [Rubroshorea leprosula]|uniref:MIF4G-like type 2 domain-containing protein n=1 Tax=Rubroshorea leprosula TaxID=152421 RepID=A0AAV5I6P7_9ROSI|nr:hypothetical protein SLEP1_g7526 [Rubroshorea leprosula]
MRLLTALTCSKVLQPASLVIVFETLLSSSATTVDEEKGNPSWQACADFYITCILSCLPWGGAELIEVSDTGLSFFEDDGTGKDLAEKDFLEDLWEWIQVLSSNGWKLDRVPRPHLSFEAQLVAGKSHELRPISCPALPDPPAALSEITYGEQRYIAGLKYPQRLCRLNIFPASKTEDLQPIDCFVVEEYLLDVLFFLNGCFTHLITVLERNGQMIAKICPDHDKQAMLISEVSSFWKNNAQMTAIAIDRMMGYRLISNLAIVRWVFSPTNIEQFHTSDCPWEILRNAVSKTFNRISDLRKEISSLKKSLVSAERATAQAKAELEAAESKLTLVDGEPVLGENPVRLKHLKSHAEKTEEEEVSMLDSLDAKEALLARALTENEELFLSLYRNFSNVLAERLPDASKVGTLQDLKSINSDSMAVDLEESSTMVVDNDNGGPKKSQSNGERVNNVYNIGEQEQWCLSTLGYVKAFSRPYASEIWPLIEKLDSEVLTDGVHPLFRRAVYSGLHRPTSETSSD